MTLTHQCQILDSEPKKKKIESIQEGNKLDDWFHITILREKCCWSIENVEEENDSFLPVDLP